MNEVTPPRRKPSTPSNYTPKSSKKRLKFSDRDTSTSNERAKPAAASGFEAGSGSIVVTDVGPAAERVEASTFATSPPRNLAGQKTEGYSIVSGFELDSSGKVTDVGAAAEMVEVTTVVTSPPSSVTSGGVRFRELLHLPPAASKCGLESEINGRGFASCIASGFL
ncbi:hypothetical protein R1flu_012948 [Riccia fluitans]|uniref:Uncharacterized protein n=1 Tax=Riccia fluitans TaxID=41844 RepID=A0ABD1ZCF6_9MARC